MIDTPLAVFATSPRPRKRGQEYIYEVRDPQKGWAVVAAGLTMEEARRFSANYQEQSSGE